MTRHSLVDLLGDKYPELYGVLGLIDSYLRINKEVTGKSVHISLTRPVKRWRYFPVFVRIHALVTMAGIKNYDEYFRGPMQWWWSKVKRDKAIIPPPLFLQQWTIDLYRAQALDRHGVVRERDKYLGAKVAIIHSASLIRTSLGYGMPYQAALAQNLDVLEPEYLATDSSYMNMVLDGLLNLDPRVSTEWEKMRCDPQYRKSLLEFRQLATR